MNLRTNWASEFAKEFERQARANGEWGGYMHDDGPKTVTEIIHIPNEKYDTVFGGADWSKIWTEPSAIGYENDGFEKNIPTYLFKNTWKN